MSDIWLCLPVKGSVGDIEADDSGKKITTEMNILFRELILEFSTIIQIWQIVVS